MMIRRMPPLLSICLPILLAFFAWVSPARALDPEKAFHHYVRNTWSIQAGLPQITVLAIAQDHQGYIWVGTQAGLARFDGIRFTAFTDEDHPQLPGVFTRSLLVDKSGALWVGTYKGLAVYRNGLFASIPAADPVRFPVLDISALAQTKEGRVVAATSRGVFEVRQNTLVFLEQGPVVAQSVLERSDGLWVGSIGGAYRLANDHSDFFPLPKSAAAASVNCLVEAQGRLWAGTSQGLYVQSDNQWRAATDSPALQKSPVVMVFEDSKKNLWVSSNAGLARLREGALTEFVPERSPGSLTGVISAFEDREGNLWLGSQWEGLSRLWNGFTKRYSFVEGLIEPIVWSLSKAPDGRIWVGTNDGLSVFEDGRFRQVLRGDQLPHPQAYNLLAEADQIWIGTRRGLVLWRNGKLEVPALFAPMAGVQINGIVRDSRGIIWIPTSDGVFKLVDGKLEHYGTAEGLMDARVRQVRELRDGRILVATQNGLYEFRGQRFQSLGLDAGLHPDMDISAMAELSDGSLAIGTLDEELFVFDGKRWQVFGPKQGLPKNAPFFITDANDGNLWLAGIRGISRVPLAQLHSFQRGEIAEVSGEMVLNERGDRRSGQQGYCCNGAGNSKGFIANDVLWLPSRDGVVSLNIHSIVGNAVAPSVVIERLHYQEKWLDIESFHSSSPLQLPEDARDLAFEFAALSFQDPASVTLRFRLRGYDSQWRDLKEVSPRSVNYTNLPAGDYTFEVVAANNSGTMTLVPAHLSFRIAPHFRETVWFYLLLAVLLLAIVYSGFVLQQRSHRRQQFLLENEVAERTQQLKEVNALLEHASLTDPLTGLRNRRYLGNQLPADMAYYEREYDRASNDEQVLLFALVDIDHFKRVNDTYGHKAGDLVIQQFAQVLTRLVRTGDYCVRWGGEEFLLVFRPMPRQYVPVLGERIRRSVTKNNFDIGNEMTLPLSCSVGLAEYQIRLDAGQQLHWEHLVELADAALYWIKLNGRDGWAVLRTTDTTTLATLPSKLHLGAQALLDSGELSQLSSVPLSIDSQDFEPS